MSAALRIRVQWNELGEKAIVDIVTAEQTSRKLSASVQLAPASSTLLERVATRRTEHRHPDYRPPRHEPMVDGRLEVLSRVYQQDHRHEDGIKREGDDLHFGRGRDGEANLVALRAERWTCSITFVASMRTPKKKIFR